VNFRGNRRGGCGSPLVLLHGFTDRWTVWSPLRAELERHHDVLALPLPGHAGADPTPEGFVPTMHRVADILERELDAAGITTAHVAGCSLGGWLAFELAARGRARSVAAFAPAGGWQPGSRDEDRVNFVFRLSDDPACCSLTLEYLSVMRNGAFARLGAVDCPTRIAWCAEDRIVRWPSCFERFPALIPDAEFVELRGVGHQPMVDDPAQTARVILELTQSIDGQSAAPAVAA
jgi:pimeloyl-ACP methyl ester carboxylesterase